MEIQTDDNGKIEKNIVFVESPEEPLDELHCTEPVDHGMEAQCVTRSKTTRKVKSEEASFEFKASTSSDVIDNHAWSNLVN